MFTSKRLLRAADNLVNKHFAVGNGETVLITADTATESKLIQAVADAVIQSGGKPLVAMAPQLPFQGGLSDPYVSDALKAAVVSCDVWFDFCFPYHAGSGAHSAAMDANRCRYALLALAEADSFERLYGCVDFAAMMDFNVALAEFFAEAAGQQVRFTCPKGTDVTLTLDKLKMIRQRVCQSPGMNTVPGTQSFYPVMDTVKGRIVIQALFDEYHRALREPITIEVDGKIKGFTGGGTEDRPSLARALRRFHPGTMLTQRQFIEDIRLPGSNAIGMGLPWWEPGGGENHPDGIVFDQSLWVGDVQLVKDGDFVGPGRLAKLHEALSRRLD